MLHQLEEYRITKMLLMICVLSVVAGAQYEYGTPSELHGLKRVMIDTGASANDYNKIKNEIDKAKLDLVIVTEDNRPEILLAFKDQGNWSGAGLIALPRGDAEHPSLRILYNFERSAHRAFTANSVKFAEKFISLYRKANDIKQDAQPDKR